MGMAQTAMLLSLSSGTGCASLASLIRRFFGAHLTPSAIAKVVLGCIVATLAVLVSGIHLKGGGLWGAGSWWFAMSLGLWFYDGRGASPKLARERQTMGRSHRWTKRSRGRRPEPTPPGAPHGSAAFAE